MTQHTILIVSVVASFALAACAFAADGSSAPPSTYLLDGRSLMETRRRALASDPALTEGIKALRQRADRQMKIDLWSVTSKPFAGPSGDKHDYVSLASYFWPDPAVPNGLPYISRDGQLNPETLEYDRTRLDGMAEAVQTLSLAYYLTGDESYAKRAADQLRVFFLDEATRMNPHLRNAQMVKGKSDGNPFGLIETEQLTRVVDAVALLRDSPSWPAEDDKRLKQWFDQYLTWLQTSDLGKKEAAAKNNHGTLYDVQTTVFALFLGRNDLAKEILENAKTKRIATQIEPDGSQPAELKRTKAWSYSLLNLTGLFHLAHLGEHVNVDLWSFKTTDGRSIRAALDWMMPYAAGKPWEKQQITRQNFSPMVYILRHAAAAYKEPAYERAIAELKAVEREVVWINLLYPAK